MALNPAINSFLGKLYHGIISIPLFIAYKFQFINFKLKSRNFSKRFSLKFLDFYPCLFDKTENTTFDAHYIYHPAWAARILAQYKPKVHIDISSTIAFCTMLSAFINTKFYDFRPAKLDLDNLSSDHADLLSLPFDNDSIESLSCMHVVEHIGLGRYGDPLNYDADLKAISELSRVVATGGNLLFVVPVGKNAKILFNAHRIYTYKQIIDYFNGFDLMEFSLVSDNGDFLRNASQKLSDEQIYGCGCFWFKKVNNLLHD
ncbi:MAG: DUF268 domain-containing protein [FCB group bacterium]|jgi:SAM-dependent methyltransferase